LEAVFLRTAEMSAANSACWKVPLHTSSRGSAISLQGFSANVFLSLSG